MIIRFILTAITMAALLAPSACAAAPLEAFVRSPQYYSPTISPNGRYLAIAQKQTDDTFVEVRGFRQRQETVVVIAIIDLQTPGAKPALITNHGYPMWVRWASDERLLVSAFGDDGARVYAFDPMGKNETTLFRNLRMKYLFYNGAQIVHLLPQDPKHVLIGAGDEYGRFNLYKANIYDGEAEIVAQANSATYRWLTDLQGVPRVRWDRDNTTQITKIYLRRGDSDDWKMVSEYQDLRGAPTLQTGGPLARIVGFADDPTIAIVASRANGDRYALYEFNTLNASLGRQLLQHPRVDVGWPDGDPVYDPYTTKLLGFSFVDDVELTHYFDPELASLQQRLDASFPDTPIVHPIAWSLDRKKIVVAKSGPTDPGSYYLYDVSKNTAAPIGKVRPDLPPGELGQMLMIKYTARDGTKIPGYLTLPPGKGDKNLPMVVSPHGGPEVRDSIGYNSWLQMMANRGYAVFQPNFRGSGGYGRAWTEAGYRQWGRMMQDDITDGVKALIKDGTADPNRICIAGWSFGGYAALAGGAFTPELYKCIISVAGISDINLLLTDVRNATGGDSYSYANLVKWVGDPSRDGDLIKAASPINFAARFQAPVLLIHGAEDTTVRYHHSVLMDKALFKAGKRSKLIVHDFGEHSLRYTPYAFKTYQETEKFLAENIGK